jgi:AraC-like DNA-binding protein
MPQFLTITLIFLAALHLYNNWRIQPHSLFLSGALVFITPYFITHYLFIYGVSVFWLAVFYGHFTPLYYLIGPCLLFYVRGVLSDSYRLKKRDLWHFLPFFLELIARIDYFLKSWSHKLWVAEQIVKDIRNMHQLNDEFFPPSNIALPLRMGFMIGYSCYCLWLVWTFRRNYSSRLRVPIQVANVSIRFLLYLLSIYLVAMVSLFILLAMFLTDRSVEATYVISSPLLTISFLGLVSIPLIMQMHPDVLYGIPRWRARAAENMGEEEKTEADSMPAEQEVVGLKDRFTELAVQIGRLMEEQKPFLDPEFTLDDLARTMQVPKHHLYYCFNHILQKKFIQFKSEYRIQYAQQLIANGHTKDKTLEAIGLESGFSSRTSFIRVFREMTGMAPRDYQRLVEERAS